jgi:hypothetical protein
VDTPLELATVVRVRSWTWLFQIGSSLGVELCVVDLGSAPVLLAPGEPVPSMLHDPEFVAAVGRAQRAQSAEVVQIGTTQVACVVLRVAGSDAGVLAVSRTRTPKRKTDPEEWRLEQIAAFLRRAIESHLESDAGSSGEEAQRLTALRRALTDYESGSELDVIRVFGTAVSIWEDVDVRAYYQAVTGEYVQQWAPAGAAADRIPTSLSLPPAMRARELSRVPVQSLDQLGITASVDLTIAHVEANGSRWLFMFNRPPDPGCVTRLSLYIDVVEQSLKHLALSGTLQLCRTVWDRLLAADDNPGRAADAALGEIARAIGGDFAALRVTPSRSGQTLAAGDVDRFANMQTAQAARQIVVNRRVDGAALTLAVGREEDRVVFSSGDRDHLEAVADVLEAWAGALARRPAPAAERRAVARPYHQVVEEIVRQTVRSGSGVSVLVIRLAGVREPGIAHRLAAQIRSHLRAAEPAGALGDEEIAAVLFDANPDQARAVVSRLRALGPTLDDGDALMSAAMGVAYCAAGSVHDTPLLDVARQDALRSRSAPSRGRVQ